MTEAVKLPEPVYEKAKEVQREMDFATMGEAVRHMCREGGFDV